MTGKIASVEELAPFLGVDMGEKENRLLVAGLRASAIEELCRVTGIDWTKRSKVESFNEALRIQVWLSYYGVRDGAKNTTFLVERLSGLINSLQLCAGEED